MNTIVLPAALLGSFISHLLDRTVLSLFIGALLFFVAGLMLLKQTAGDRKLLKVGDCWYVLLFIGATSTSMAGLAIGIVLIPLLFFAGEDIKLAGRYSIAIAVVYTCIATIGYIAFGWSQTASMPYCLGYVYYPAVDLPPR